MNAPGTSAAALSEPRGDDASCFTPARRSILLALAWGLFVVWLVARGLLLPGPGQFVANHDHQGYGLRLIEFRECLARGYVFPQWCAHFRGGLGSPFFCYYQSGFYYAGSLTPASWPMARQVAATSLLFGFVGYVGMWGLVRRVGGDWPAVAAATLFLTAPYVYAELFIRGDYSEYAAMMLVPGFLWGLTSFMERPSVGSALGSAGAGASLVCTHPAVSLVGFGLASLFLLSRLAARAPAQFVRGVLACAAACGFAAFYWLPVFLESSWVSAEQAWQGKVFDGYYHYSKHFLPLSWMIGTQVTPTPIPVKLGLVHGLALVGGLLLLASGWRRSAPRLRSVAVCGLLFCGVSLWLITPSSALLWRHLPLLERIQFPWRLLSLVYVGGALIVGTGLAMLRRPLVVRIAALLLVASAAGLAGRRGAPQRIVVPEPSSAAAIAEHFFAPDLADEWLPRGAQPLRISAADRRPVGGPGVSSSNYVYDAAGLRCEVRSESESYVVLPHYYFPSGWDATLDGRPTALEANEAGLMRVTLPADFSGELAVRWRTTRARWLGVALSLVTLLSWTAAATWRLRNRPAGATKRGAENEPPAPPRSAIASADGP